MNSNRHIWLGWAQKLHSWGLGDWIASILEGFGPLTWLGAQLVYLGQPLLSQVGFKSQLHALASLLEDPESGQIFIGMLREEISQ